MALALRTPAGVPWPAIIDPVGLAGLVERHGDRAVLTVAGRMLASEITMRLDVSLEEPIEPAGSVPR